MCDESYCKINEFGDKSYYKNGTKPSEYIFHRTDGPAVECVNGDKYWYINGKRHREDGPAIEYSNGTKYWYINGKRHREDGPVIEYSNGNKYWYINGELHREDGPAIERANGNKEWWINNIQYSKKEYWKLIKLKAFI